MTADNAAPTPARDDLRERLTALADEWERQGKPDSMMRKTGERYADILRALLADTPESDTRGEAACNCYPGGFTGDTYEGPREDCPEHGRPAPAVAEGTDVEAWDESDRRDVSRWLIEEADQRVKFFPQRRDGVDALIRHLAERLVQRRTRSEP